MSKKPPPPPDDEAKSKKKKLPKPPAGVHKVKAASAIKPKEKREVKTFQVATWSGSKEGEMILGYADSGMGKTTLATMAPTPVFLGLDPGGRKIHNPITGEELKHIPGIENFSDFRDALRQHDLYNDYETVVVDTGTILQDWCYDWVLENITNDKGEFVLNIEKFGWGKGHRHVYDTMRLPLVDMDALVRKGKNIIILCQMQQASIANSAGDDFLCDVPKLALQHGKTPSVWGLYTAWADHVFKIGYSDQVVKERKAKSSTERLIYLHGQVHFKAKSRTVPGQFPLVTFSEPSDDSLWKFIFEDAWRDLLEDE
jgi:hypothetical protein